MKKKIFRTLNTRLPIFSDWIFDWTACVAVVLAWVGSLNLILNLRVTELHFCIIIFKFPIRIFPPLIKKTSGMLLLVWCMSNPSSVTVPWCNSKGCLWFPTCVVMENKDLLFLKTRSEFCLKRDLYEKCFLPYLVTMMFQTSAIITETETTKMHNLFPYAEFLMYILLKPTIVRWGRGFSPTCKQNILGAVLCSSNQINVSVWNITN